MTSKFQANKIIQEIAPIVGGKGGGRPESAQGGGPDASKIDKALAEAKKLLGQTLTRDASPTREAYAGNASVMKKVTANAMKRTIRYTNPPTKNLKMLKNQP